MTHTAPIPPDTTSSNAKGPPVLRFDWQEWTPYLEGVPEDQQQALIETLWTIVLAFADLGFAIKDEAQSCGQMLDLKAALEAAMVNSEEMRNAEETLPDREKEDA